MPFQRWVLLESVIEDFLFIYFIFIISYLFITCNWVDTRWQEPLHVTLSRTVKILL